MNQYSYVPLVTKEVLEIHFQAMHTAGTSGTDNVGLFYKYAHYEKRWTSQQSEHHWFFLHSGNTGVNTCTCGLETLLRDCESAQGHRDFISLEPVIAFISEAEYRPRKGIYRVQAFCQGCHSRSRKGLSTKRVKRWISKHRLCETNP